MNRIVLLMAASTTALAAAAPGAAQTEAAGEEVVRVERIVVTTQKREEVAFDVPITLSAFSDEDLELFDIRAFDELSDFTPGLTVQLQSPNNPAFVIRGITSDNGNFQEPPRVSVYLNGVDVSRSRGSAFELFDIERVEVVKGPQATLFGTAASIGAVSVITARPQEEFSGEAYFGAGNEGYGIVGGHITGGTPLVQGRLAFQYRTLSGYIDNIAGDPDSNSFDAQGDLNGIDTIAVRPSLRFTPSDNFTLDIVYNFEENSPPGTSFKSGAIAPTGGTTDPNSPAELGGAFGNPILRFEGVNPVEIPGVGTFFEPVLTLAGDEDIEAVLGGRDLGLERTLHDVNITAEWGISEAFDLTAVFGYREFDSLEVFDADGSQVPLLELSEDTEGEQLSGELRLNYDQGGRFRGFVGVNYFQEEGFQRAPFVLDETIFGACLTAEITLSPFCVNEDGSFNRLNLDPLTAATQPLIPADQGFGVFYPAEFTNFADNETISFFADLTFDVTDRLQLTVGARYIYEELESGLSTFFADSLLINQEAALDPSIPAPVFSPLLAGFSNTNNQVVSAGDDFDDILPRFNALYRINEQLNVYGTIAKGRRSPAISITQDGSGESDLPLQFDFPVNDCSAIPADQQPFATIDCPFSEQLFLEQDIVLPPAQITPEEIVWNYEIGFRAEFLNGRARLDGALFYQDYQDFRVQIPDIEDGGIRNLSAGEATNVGLEFEGEFLASDHLTLLGSFAYIDAEIGDDEENNGQFAGNRFRLQPEYSGALTADYRRPITADINGFFTSSLTYRSDVFFEPENQPEFTEDDVTLVDLRGGFTLENDLIEISAFVKNVFDEDYIIDAGNTGADFGSGTFIAGPPRLWGVQVTGRF